MSKFDTKKITVSAMLAAVAFVVTILTSYLKVSGFLSLDFKDAILSIISLLFGPFYGVVSVIAVALFELITVSSTGLYGFVMNMLSSGTFVIVSGFIYKYKRSFSGAVISAISCVLVVTSVMLLANIFITPLYFQMPRAAVIDMLPTVLLPFNLCKSLLNSALMLLIYKPITAALKRSRLIPQNSSSNYMFNLKTALMTVVSVIVIVCALLFIFIKLGVQFK